MIDRTRDDTQKLVDQVPFWFHSIDLGERIVTPGHKSPEILAREVESMRLPNLEGKSVLDIGSWDGFFSFEAERRGAARVLAIDHYAWSVDRKAARHQRGLDKRSGRAMRDIPDIREAWDPVGLPGKKGFDTAHRVLDSKVDSLAADFMTVDPEEVGRFDVVLFLGVLYHMKDPFAAIRRVAELTTDLAVIETEAMYVPGQEQRCICEFFPGSELNGDSTNWWVPNARAVEGMCLAAGFQRVESLRKPRSGRLSFLKKRYHYRGTFHAYK